MKMFVYGTLKFGEANNGHLDGCKFVGNAISTEGKYFMVGSGIPFLYKGGMQFVAGEIWEVDAKAVERIDRLEGHPYRYRREQQTFIVCGETVTAWVYIVPRGRHVWEHDEKYRGAVVWWPPSKEIADDRRVGLVPSHATGQDGEVQ